MQTLNHTRPSLPQGPSPYNDAVKILKDHTRAKK